MVRSKMGRLRRGPSMTSEKLEAYANKIQAIHNELKKDKNVPVALKNLDIWLVEVRKKIGDLRSPYWVAGPGEKKLTHRRRPGLTERNWADLLEGYANKIQALRDELKKERDVRSALENMTAWLVKVKTRITRYRA